MELKALIASFLLFVTLTAAVPRRGDMDPPTEIPKVPAKVCGGKPADVVFLLDESSSIWIEHFTVNLKNFIKDIIDIFEISPTLTRIGALTFGNYPRLAFRLNDFTSEEEVLKAIDDITQRGGNTDTAGGLKFMREKMFKARYGGRKNQIQIGIVITDGVSDNKTATRLQARLAREQGIHIFAIGVGNAKEEELKSIASKPSDKFVFRVTNYGHLNTIKEMLAIQTCKVTDAPITVKPTTTPQATTKPTTTPQATTKPTTTPQATTKPTTTPQATTTVSTTAPTTEVMVGDRACGNRAPADIMFIIPETASSKDSDRALTFIHDVTEEFEISENGVQVGLVPKLCKGINGISLDDYSDKDKFHSQLLHSMSNNPNTAKQLHHLRTRSFTQCHGARDNSKKVAVVLIDEKSADVKETMEEAKKLKRADVEVFVVAIGKDTDPKEVAAIASALPEHHILTITSYKELPLVVDQVKKSINDACADFLL